MIQNRKGFAPMTCLLPSSKRHQDNFPIFYGGKYEHCNMMLDGARAPLDFGSKKTPFLDTFFGPHQGPSRFWVEKDTFFGHIFWTPPGPLPILGRKRHLFWTH